MLMEVGRKKEGGKRKGRKGGRGGGGTMGERKGIGGN
jgi:hypothetical protein